MKPQIYQVHYYSGFHVGWEQMHDLVSDRWLIDWCVRSSSKEEGVNQDSRPRKLKSCLFEGLRTCVAFGEAAYQKKKGFGRTKGRFPLWARPNPSWCSTSPLSKGLMHTELSLSPKHLKREALSGMFNEVTETGLQSTRTPDKNNRLALIRKS